MIRQQLACGENHPRSAKTALQRMLVPEGLLQRIEIAILRQALDRKHLAPLRLHREHRAALHRHAVEHHGARSADRSLATDVRAGQSGHLAQVVDQ